MPIPTPFHSRAAKLCPGISWRDWAGYVARERAARALGAGIRTGARAEGLELRDAPGALAARAMLR